MFNSTQAPEPPRDHAVHATDAQAMVPPGRGREPIMTEPGFSGTPSELDPLPEKRRSRRWWIISAAAVVVAVVVTITIVLTLTGGSSSGTERYGQRAVDVMRALHVCNQPEPNGNSVALCKFEDGGGATIHTTTDDFSQSMAVAMIKDGKYSDWCYVAAKGYVLGAPTVGYLTRAVGIPEAFAVKHHGYLFGGCG